MPEEQKPVAQQPPPQNAANQPVYYIIQSPYPPPPGAVYAGTTYATQGSPDAEMGGQPSETFGSSFDDDEIRRAFIRKVFAILTIQLLFTAFIVSLFLFIEPMNHFIKKYWWIIFIAWGFTIVFMCMLMCCDIRRKFPANYIVLTLFTLGYAVMLAGICVYYSVYALLMALGITSLICCAVSLAALLCPVDITGCGCMLCLALMAFLIFSLIATLVQMFIGYITILQIVLGALGTALFSLFLMYDIQLVMGGKKVELSPEEHVVAVIQIYMDIILIFQYVLMLVGICEQN